jgi:N-dimethylarginine dimethylaminohydrolase
MAVALQAIRHLLEGRGYEPSPIDIDEAVEHLMVAAARLDEVDQARQALQRIAGTALSAGLMAERLAWNIAALSEADRDG